MNALAARPARAPRASSPAATEAAPPAGHTWPAEAAIAALAAAAIGVYTFRGSLGYGFSQDDFSGLARATGHAGRLPFGWRWLSHQLFWDAVAGPLGRSATAAHAVVLAFHAATAALLAWLLARRLPAPAALLGAAFVASHPASFTALYWAAANGDVLAAFFALASLGLGLGRRARWLALPCYSLALLAKESALPLPAAWLAIALFWPRPAGEPGPAPPKPWRDPVWLACSLFGVAFAAYAWLVARGTAVGGEVYGTSLAAVGGNVLTYDGWVANRWLGTVQSVMDHVDPRVFGWGVALNVAWLAGALVPALRRAGWIAAGVAWTVLLAPVLPLTTHTYHYYMVIALPAAGLMLAAIGAVALPQGPRAAAWAAAGILAALIAWDGHALVQKIEHAPFQEEGSRSDPTLDGALIASHALGDLAAAALPPHTRLVLWSPQSQAIQAREGGSPEKEGYYESNVRAALLDGLALRVMLPAIDSVRFARTFDAAATSDQGTWWAVYRFDGHLKAMHADELARVLAQHGAQ